MGNYVYGTTQSYSEWLQAERLHSIELSVPRSTREIVASVEELSRANVELHDGVQEGFDRVCFALSDISAGITELDATFHWGFSEVINSLGRVNDSLDELKRIAKTPAQTWAYEQYEIARDAIRRRLWPEALVALDRAINGRGDQPGYALEFRFHHARGMIYLGNFRNADPAIIDLAKAEESFLAAGRYAKADYPWEAARCLLAAGWAGYCQGKMPESLKHTQRAVALHPKLPEALFQVAKIHMHVDQPEAALTSLRSAIDLDRLYALKAGGDEDFRRHEARVQDFMITLADEVRVRSVDTMAAAESEIKRGDELKADVLPALAKLEEARKNFESGTYFGYLDCIKESQQATSEALTGIDTRHRELELANADRLLRAKHVGFRLACVVGFGILLVLGLGMGDLNPPISGLSSFLGLLAASLGVSGVGASLATSLPALFVPMYYTDNDSDMDCALGAMGGLFAALGLFLSMGWGQAATLPVVVGGIWGFCVGMGESLLGEEFLGK